MLCTGPSIGHERFVVKVERHLRPIDLARAGGLSTESVRKYEGWGFLPPAERSPAGYRLYTQRHLQAMETARTVIAGYGWIAGREIMGAVHAGDVAAAVAEVDGRHADLHTRRLQLEETLRALRAISDAEPLPPPPPRSPVGRRRSLLIGEAAKAVGTTVPSIRFWERQGLLEPTRDRTSGYRLYDREQMRRLRVTVLLRSAGYGFDTIHIVLRELASERLDRALDAIEQRRSELTAASRRCLAAAAALSEYLADDSTARRSAP